MLGGWFPFLDRRFTKFFKFSLNLILPEEYTVSFQSVEQLPLPLEHHFTKKWIKYKLNLHTLEVPQYSKGMHMSTL